MWITKVSINNPVFATMVMVALIVLGLFSYQSLRVEAEPDVEYPGMYISVSYPGASPEMVENEVSRPLEIAANAVSGVRKVNSYSSEGGGFLWIELDLSTNMDRAIQELRDKVAVVTPRFPREVKVPTIGRRQENVQPFVFMSLNSTNHSQRELSTLTDQVIVKSLQNVAGVGQVNVSGDTVRQILVNLNPSRMAAQHVGVDEVMRAIQSTNQDMPAGIITHGATEQLVRVEGKIKDAREFGKVIVARRANGPVFLDQVADIVDGEHEEMSISRMNGHRSININVAKTQDANIIEVGDGVKKAVEDLQKRLPPDVTLNLSSAESDTVRRQLNNVKMMIVEGAALTVLIVFLFLQSWRSTVITALTLPISVVATFIAMKAFGFTINALTLMALSLSIGLLIDDAIVVRENIVRHLGMGKSHVDSASDGTNEIGLAVMATTFAIVAVFIPVAFMRGIIGRYFLQFGITVAIAVMVSLFVSFTLDPMLSSVWHDPAEGRFSRMPWLRRIMEKIERGIESVHALYGRILGWSLRWRKVTLAIALALFAASFLIVPMIGTEMYPKQDQGYIPLGFKTPIGSSLAYTDSKIVQIEKALQDFPEIKTTLTSVGGENGSNRAHIDLMLTNRQSTGRAPQYEVEARIRERLKSIPGIELSVGWGKPIRIEILGQNLEKLDAAAQEVMRKLAKIPGIADIENGQATANPTIKIKINNALASDLGLSVQQIGAALRPFVAGDTVGNWLAADGQNYEVNVQLPKSGRQKITDLGDLFLASSNLAPDGTPIMVPLRQVVEFIPSSSPQTISRQGLQRSMGVYANVAGRPMGDASADVQAMIKTIALPPGVRFNIGGQVDDMQEMFHSASIALGIAIIFIYLVLASQFGSFLQPLAIMVSLPLSLIGVLLALLVTGSTLNILSVIGFIMLMGLVTKNAILLVDFTNQAQRQGLSQSDAIMSAGQVRLRPILMTTLAMIFGMLPMALGQGEGGEIQAPMGRAVIGGVLTSTLLTLVVVPVAYAYLDSWGKRALRYFRKGSTPQAESASSAAGAEV